jgi:hypothetical protein
MRLSNTTRLLKEVSVRRRYVSATVFSPSSGCLWVSLVSYTCNVTWMRWGVLGELVRECGQACVGVLGSVVVIPCFGLILSLCLKFVCV